MEKHKLPDIYFIRASPSSPSSDEHEQEQERYVMCMSEYNDVNRSWSSVILNGSQKIIGDTKWMEDGEPTEPEEYIHERKSSRHETTSYYTSIMSRTNRYMKIGAFEKLYEYTMTRPNVILPTKFYRVYMNQDPTMKWHFVTVNLAEMKNIPVHVQEGFIELAILKKEQCPITMEPFVCGNVACTPCGHLFSKDGLKNVSLCPLCREKI